MGSEKYISTRFRQISKLFRSAKERHKLLIFKRYIGTIFGKWMHFQICLSLWELQVTRDLLCLVREIAEKSLNRLLLLLILKSSTFHRKTLVLESCRNKFGGLRIELSEKKTLTQVFFQWNLRNNKTYFEEHWWTSASVSLGNFIYNAWKRYS